VRGKSFLKVCRKPLQKRNGQFTQTHREKWLVVCWAGLEKRKKERERGYIIVLTFPTLDIK
jgi:hypothetical protein